MPYHSVLVVDDNRQNRETLCEVLTDLGWRSEAEASGLAALHRLRQQAWDAVVSDVDMPDISGFELLSRLRQVDIICPMVLMSARADDQLRHAAQQAGVAQLFAKPIQLLSFTGFLTKLLN